MSLAKDLDREPNGPMMMAIIAGLLAPTEWPIEWEAQRPELVRALTQLARETRPGVDAGSEPPAFFAQVELGPERAAFELAHRTLATAVDLLSTPCRRDQVASVANLCNLATSTLRVVYQRALAVQGEGAMREPLLGAHLRYRVAALRYNDAALAMNDAIGAVIFHPFDAAGPPAAPALLAS